MLSVVILNGIVPRLPKFAGHSRPAATSQTASELLAVDGGLDSSVQQAGQGPVVEVQAFGE